MSEEHVQSYIAEAEARSIAQLNDRALISDAIPLAEDCLRKMDSTLKRTTAFMKKLRNLNTAQYDAIIADLEKVKITFLGA